MTHLIDKDALVAEIKKLMNRYDSEYDEDSTEVKAAKGNVCHEILCTIDSLEVKEVDLEKEIQQHLNDCLDIKFPTTDTKIIAKDVECTARKFFELGLKAQKEE